jgi:hypothetical protein
MFNAIALDDLEPLLKIDDYTVQFTAIAAGEAMPISNTSPRNILHYSTPAKTRKIRNL